MPEPDDERALFEAAVAALEAGGESSMLRRKSGSGSKDPGRAKASSPPGKPPAEARGGAGRPRLRRRLKTGEEVEKRLDLHGLDRASALRALAGFVRAGSPGELLLVIHGKGRGILARAVADALTRSPRVAEHVPAPPRLGGTGATVIRIRSR